MIVEIKIEIKNCLQCHHIDHSGAFTPGGAKTICGHSNACDTFKDRKDQYHWRHRIIKDPENKIPAWCPLLRGCKY